MNLSEDNKDILKALSKVNDQVFFTSNTLGMASNDDEMIAYYDYGIIVNMPDAKQTGFGIYNLGEFLQIVDSYDEPTLTEGANSITISEDDAVNEYRYSDEECIKQPPSKNDFFNGNKATGAAAQPAADSTFQLSKSDIEKIQKQATILRSPHIKFDADQIIATDVDDSSCNTYSKTILPDNPIEEVFVDSKKFNAIIAKDYVVGVTESNVVFKSTDNTLIFVIAALSE